MVALDDPGPAVTGADGARLPERTIPDARTRAVTPVDYRGLCAAYGHGVVVLDMVLQDASKVRRILRVRELARTRQMEIV